MSSKNSMKAKGDILYHLVCFSNKIKIDAFITFESPLNHFKGNLKLIKKVFKTSDFVTHCSTTGDALLDSRRAWQ